jgi:protease IV
VSVPLADTRFRNGEAVARRSVVTFTVIAIIAFMTVAGIVLAALHSTRGDAGLGFGSRIALIEVHGVIGDDIATIRQLQRFRRDGSVRGYVVSIDSPGGVVGPSQSIFRELKRIREEDGVPVVASIGGIGASGGYYIALAADSILALPGSITGSIGVIIELPDASELLDRVGVRFEVVKSAEHKDVGSPFRPMSEGDRALLSEMVMDVYDQFVDAVAEERGLSRDAVLAVADGRIVSGRQALASGLIDGLGNVEDAIAAAGRMAGLGAQPRLARPPEPRPTMLDVLLSGTAGALGRLVAPLAPAAAIRVQYTVPW